MVLSFDVRWCTDATATALHAMRIDVIAMYGNDECPLVLWLRFPPTDRFGGSWQVALSITMQAKHLSCEINSEEPVTNL